MAAEELVVGKRRIRAGRVRVRKAVRERQVLVDEPLLRERIEVQRVRVDRVVEAAPPIRQEGDTVVVPLVEETLVVEKRLVLTEEIRITKRRAARREPRRFTLRSEEAVVERARAPDERPPPPGAAA